MRGRPTGDGARNTKYTNAPVTVRPGLQIPTVVRKTVQNQTG